MAPFFIPLVFGKSYEVAVAPVLILIFSAPSSSRGAMFSAIWKSPKKPSTAAKGQGVGLLLTITMLPVAIIYLGIDVAVVLNPGLFCRGSMAVESVCLRVYVLRKKSLGIARIRD